MSFSRAKINTSNKPLSASATGIRAGIRGNKLPRLFLNLTKEVAKKLSLMDGHLLDVLIGEGEHHGLIRFRLDMENGNARVDEAKSKGEGFFQILLGNQQLYVQHPVSPEDCQWEVLDDGYVEIVLPKWADETRKKSSGRQVVERVAHALDGVRYAKTAAIAQSPSKAKPQAKGPVFERPKPETVTRPKPVADRVIKVQRKPSPLPISLAPKKVNPRRPVSPRLQETARQLFGDPPPSRSALAERQENGK